MRPLLPFLALLGLASGCKIADTVYQGPGGDDDDDGGVDAPIDSPPSGIHVEVTPTSTSVGEGGQVTVQVRLSEAPAADRTIEVQAGSLLTPTPSTVTFTPDNWNVNRTVILAAGQDDDAVDSPVTVLFFGNGQVGDGSAMIMITDDDTLSLVVTPPSSIGITEGATGTVSVSLAAMPISNVVVSVTTANGQVATVTPASLSFSTTNWATPQDVTVTAVDNFVIGQGVTQLVLDPVPEGIATHQVQIDVTDNDELQIDVAPTALSLVEPPGSPTQGTIMVRLTTAPASPLDVTLAANPGGEV
jgi:hypothetical protein